MMGRETTGKGHPWMGGHCKYDGWMTGERHVFFLRMLLLLFVFVFDSDFDFLSLLLTARNDGWPLRHSRLEDGDSQVHRVTYIWTVRCESTQIPLFCSSTSMNE